LLVALERSAFDGRGNGFVGQAIGPIRQADHAVNGLKGRESGRLRCTRLGG
jgi:hypothetical protein